MMISLRRPTNQYQPSASRRARSPVTNHPSRSASAVAAGLFQYPVAIASLRNSTSPSSASRPPAPTSRSVTPSVGSPKEPSRLGPNGGFIA